MKLSACLARLHLKPSKFDREAAEADPLIAIAGGGGVNLFNSQGNAWTADYLKITGELDVDLRSNIAAEARAKIVYERLINFCDDAGTKDALQFLMTREITHMKAFAAALESMGKPAFSIGRHRADAGTGQPVLQRFHRVPATKARSTPAAPGMKATTGFSSIAGACRYRAPSGAAAIVTESSPPEAADGLDELLIDRTSRHPPCGKATDQGAAEDGRRRLASISCGNCSSCISQRPKARSNASTSASTCSARPPAPSLARA